MKILTERGLRRGCGVALVLLFSLAVASGCAGGRAGAGAKESPAHPLLAPWFTLPGARLAAKTDGTGTPLLRFGAAPYTPFVHPVAVAALGNDVYVADFGARKLYRFDLALQAMVAVPGVSIQPGTRLSVGRDFSFYVLDPAGRRVLHFARSGQLLATFRDGANLGQPVALAADEANGLFLIADRVYNHIVAFHPLGRASLVVSLRGGDRNRVLQIGGFAVAPDALYVSDPGCGCVARVMRDGKVLETFGHHELRRPGAIAVDRQRVFVADQFDASLKVFEHGRLVHHVSAGALGVVKISDLWISEGLLYIADGLGARIVALRLAPAANGG